MTEPQASTAPRKKKGHADRRGLMQPVGTAIYSDAIVALEAGQITMMGALERSSSPLRHFILKDGRDLPTILESLRQLAGEQVVPIAPILPCSTPARFHLRRLLDPFLPKVVVLPPLEIPPMVPVQSLGTVR